MTPENALYILVNYALAYQRLIYYLILKPAAQHSILPYNNGFYIYLLYSGLDQVDKSTPILVMKMPLIKLPSNLNLPPQNTQNLPPISPPKLINLNGRRTTTLAKRPNSLLERVKTFIPVSP